MNQGLGGELYTGAAAYGRIRTIIGTVIGTIVGIGLTIAGGVLAKRKAKLTDTVGSTIINEPTCHSYMNGQVMMWRCDVQLSYKVGDKEYTLNQVTNESTKYSKGQGVSIFYDPSNPSHASLTSDNIKPIGWILLVVGILMLVSSWVWLLLVLKFKIAAAAAGASAAIGDIRGAFRN